MQFADLVRIRLISSQDFSKNYYFNSTVFSRFRESSLLVLFNNLDLNINDSEAVIRLFGSSL